VVTVGEKIGKNHLTYAQGAAAEITAMATIGAADALCKRRCLTLRSLQSQMPVERTLHLFFCQRYRSFEFWRLQSVGRISQCLKRVLIATMSYNTYGFTFGGAKFFSSTIHQLLEFLEGQVGVPGD
jgi:hypothetical protein